MDIDFLEMEENLSAREYSMLREIMEHSEQDLLNLADEIQEAIVWCMIRALGLGHIEERKVLLNRLQVRLRDEMAMAREVFEDEDY